VTILVAGNTDIGKKRKSNQDSILILPEKNFFVVADGMGGHSGGDIASQMAVAICEEKIPAGSISDSENILREVIMEVNKRIFDRAKNQPELKGMGTTITAVWYQNNELLIGNIGDSRTYLVNNKKLYQLSRDHSLVQEKIDMGIYSRQAAAKDPQKNVLIRTVGYDELVNPDIFHYKISKNDIFLQCSDGLHGKASEHDIITIINEVIPNPQTATQQDLQNAVTKLIKLANDNGGNDNISVILSIAQENK
jgi:serine/threonine protein phosphatase PrpC